MRRGERRRRFRADVTAAVVATGLGMIFLGGLIVFAVVQGVWGAL